MHITKARQESFNKVVGWQNSDASSSNIVDEVVGRLTDEQLQINEEKLQLIQKKIAQIKVYCKKEEAELKNYDYTLARMGMQLSTNLISKKTMEQLKVTQQHRIDCLKLVEEILAIIRGAPTKYAIYVCDNTVKGQEKMQRLEYSADQVEAIFNNGVKKAGLDAITALNQFFEEKTNKIKMQEKALSQLDISEHYFDFKQRLDKVVNNAQKPGIVQEVFEQHYAYNHCKFFIFTTQTNKLSADLANAKDAELQKWQGLRRLYFARANDNASWYSGGDIGNTSVKSLNLKNINRGISSKKGNRQVLNLTSDRSLNDVINQLDYLFNTLINENNGKITANMIRQILIPFTQVIETSYLGGKRLGYDKGVIVKNVNELIKNLTT